MGDAAAPPDSTTVTCELTVGAGGAADAGCVAGATDVADAAGVTGSAGVTDVADAAGVPDSAGAIDVADAAGVPGSAGATDLANSSGFAARRAEIRSEGSIRRSEWDRAMECREEEDDGGRPPGARSDGSAAPTPVARTPVARTPVAPTLAPPMLLDLEPTGIEGLTVVRPRVFHDARGSFFESFNAEQFAAAGLPAVFAQDNHSRSRRHSLRGMHFQAGHQQGKLVRAGSGQVFDVAVDMRPSSPTFGRWFGIMLSARNRLMLYVPPGFAHGFLVVSAWADVLYKVTTPYRQELERQFRWDDSEVAIAWPTDRPIVSERDAAAEGFRAAVAEAGPCSFG